MNLCPLIALARLLALVLFSAANVRADDFVRLNKALPSGVNISAIYPVFDFDEDGCYPSAAISHQGRQNDGLGIRPFHDVTGKCRSIDFMDLSNTYHRYACTTAGGVRYCAHAFMLYMLADQTLGIFGTGHRHDWSTTVIWTEKDKVTFGSYFALGDMHTAPAEKIPTQDGHSKFVYHKKGIEDHQLRFAKTGESAENPHHKFVTPPIVSWFTMKGEGVSKEQLWTLLSSFRYGKVYFLLGDARFLSLINKSRPEAFPEFTAESAAKSF